MPDFFTLMGWRWRTTLPSMARARLRLSVGMPTRKMDFQTWDLVMLFWRLPIMRPLLWTSELGGSADDEGARVVPLAELPLELLPLVDDDPAVVGADGDLGPFERPRGGPLEVDPG